MTDLDQPDDWAALGNDWRAQAASTVDVDALRNEVSRRGRQLRWALLHELAGFALAMGMCLWIFATDRAGFTPVVTIGLMAILLGFQGWSLWIRRRQVSDRGLDAMAMVELEIARAQTSLLYWRVSIWLTVAMWLGLYAVALSGVLAPVERTGDLTMGGIAPAIVVVGLACIGFALWAWWFGRRTQARLVRLRRLQDQMRDG